MLERKTFKWNREKWEHLIDSGVLEDEKVELIDGEIIQVSPERADHAFYVGRLARILRSLLEPVATCGQVLCAGNPQDRAGSLHACKPFVEPEELTRRVCIREAHPITLSASEPKPDIALVRSPEYLYLQHHPYPEDIYLAIEVSRTTLSFDLNRKLALYAQAEIPQYWVLDLEARKLIVFNDADRLGKCYRQKQEIAEGENRYITVLPDRDLAIHNLAIWN